MSIDDGYVHQLPDTDPAETKEWLDSLDAVAKIARAAPGRVPHPEAARARHRARRSACRRPGPDAVHQHHPAEGPAEEYWFPGDEVLERRIRAFIRWNAAVMVIKANKAADGIGGHLATFASSAALYDVGFNWFWRGKDDGQAGDAIYIQGHAAPGIYARCVPGGPDRPRPSSTGSVARSTVPGCRRTPTPASCPTSGSTPPSRWASARSTRSTRPGSTGTCTTASSTTPARRRVWCFVGDGETDEPETLGSIHLAGRERLDNLIWIVNCNLQRLDGPVRGNGKIIQELEAVFRGAGWNVIKVIWGSPWDELLANDVDGVLLEKMNNTVDGEFQRYTVEDGAYIREHFFGPDPRLRKMVEHLSDDELRWLPRGGHDYQQALRRLQGRHRAARRAHGDPGQDDQGVDARDRGRGPQRHAPDQEDDQQAAAGAADPAPPRGGDPRGGAGRGRRAAVLPAAGGLRRLHGT